MPPLQQPIDMICSPRRCPPVRRYIYNISVCFVRVFAAAGDGLSMTVIILRTTGALVDWYWG